MATRWGIASAGFISGDFTKGVQILPEKDHKVVAVAARNLDRAKEFADIHNIPKAYGTYEEMAKDPEIDIVYVGTIHPQHARLSKMMLAAGKHVLCEKPLCVSVQETEDLIAFAKEKKRFLMEGFWSRCFPVYHKLREEIKKGTIGEPRVVNAQFGLNLCKVPRINDPELGGGAILDVGGYPVQFTNVIFGEKPQKITTVGSLLPSGVDDTSTTLVQYSGGRLAVITSSITCVLSQRATVYGTDGIIEIPDWIWSPTDIVIKGDKFRYPLPESKLPMHYAHGEGFSYEAQHVREILLKGGLESPLMPHASTLIIAGILEESRRQLGAKSATP